MLKVRIFQAIIFQFLIGTFLFSQSADSCKSDWEGHSKFDPTRNAQKDIESAVVRAKKHNKRILLDVGGEWCIWCHRLDSLFIQNKDLADCLNAYYVIVKVNVSKENKNEKLLSKFPKVPGYPHFFVLDSSGTLIHSQETEEFEYPKNDTIKWYDKLKIISFLKKWAK